MSTEQTISKAGEATDAASNEARPLTAQDRCEGCGAQAFLVLRSPALGTFAFCAHHGRAHSPAMIEQGFVVLVDETHLL